MPDPTWPQGPLSAANQTLCSQRLNFFRHFSILADYFQSFLTVSYPTLLCSYSLNPFLCYPGVNLPEKELICISGGHVLAIKWPSFPTFYKNGQVHVLSLYTFCVASNQNRTTKNAVQEKDVWLSSRRNKNRNHRKFRMSQPCDTLKLMWS